MASSLNKEEQNQVLFEESNGVRKVILNRSRQFNCLNYEMISQMLKMLKVYEVDASVKLVILKGNGKVFCSGGDVKAVINSVKLGHWSFGASLLRKKLILDYLFGTYKKPVVSILDGIVMGGGAGLSMHTPFRIVTENTIFSMPETSIGSFPDCGASHFLSRLQGFFGEYIGLTGVRLDGTEMIACGLATHFVLSKDVALMEDELGKLVECGVGDLPRIFNTINKFVYKTSLKKDSPCCRLDVINKCFSADTVEEILSLLEKSAAECEEKWKMDAIKSIKSVSPTSLKLFLRLIREGRTKGLQECLVSEFRVLCHTIRRPVSNDVFEGTRALLFDKDKKPQWKPEKLELVSKEMVEKYFCEVEGDDDWKPLQLPAARYSQQGGGSSSSYVVSRL